MSNTLSLKLTLSGHSTEQQRRDIENELSSLFNEHGIRPPDSISCREGSTEIIIQYILDYVAQEFIAAIGAGILALIHATIHKKRKTESQPEKLGNANSHELTNFSKEEKAMKDFIEKTIIKHPMDTSQLIISLTPELESALKNSKRTRIVITLEDEEKITEIGFTHERDENNKTLQSGTFENTISK